MDWFQKSFLSIWSLVTHMEISDYIDILLVTVILFLAYRFIKERRAGRLAIGIVVLFIVMMLSNAFNMRVLNYFLSNIFQVGILMIIILFQPEIRSALEKVGGEPFRSLKGIGEQTNTGDTLSVLSAVCEAAEQFSEEKTGALIVFERTTKLGDVVKSGTVLNADVSVFLLRNIFFNKAPMHDGATIIADNRIHSAGCILPLSTNLDIIKDLGTRHRAGIGISENSDAIVVIVSEETGAISVAKDGKLRRGLTRDALMDELSKNLVTDNIYQKLKNRKKK